MCNLIWKALLKIKIIFGELFSLFFINIIVTEDLKKVEAGWVGYVNGYMKCVKAVEGYLNTVINSHSNDQAKNDNIHSNRYAKQNFFMTSQFKMQLLNYLTGFLNKDSNKIENSNISITKVEVLKNNVNQQIPLKNEQSNDCKIFNKDVSNEFIKKPQKPASSNSDMVCESQTTHQPTTTTSNNLKRKRPLSETNNQNNIKKLNTSSAITPPPSSATFMQPITNNFSNTFNNHAYNSLRFTKSISPNVSSTNIHPKTSNFPNDVCPYVSPISHINSMVAFSPNYETALNFEKQTFSGIDYSVKKTEFESFEFQLP